MFEAFSGDPGAFGLSPRESRRLDGTYCARALDGRLGNVVPDSRANPVTSALEITQASGIGSYIGVPIPEPAVTPIGW